MAKNGQDELGHFLLSCPFDRAETFPGCTGHGSGDRGHCRVARTIFQMLEAEYECSRKKIFVCGSYLYLVAQMLAKDDFAKRVYQEVRPAWEHIEEERFKARWVLGS